MKAFWLSRSAAQHDGAIRVHNNSDMWGRGDWMSMSLFRIALACFLAYTAFFEIKFFTELYTDQGVLPRSVLVQDWTGTEFYSLLTASNFYLFHWLFIAIQCVAIIAFAIGYRTRLATIILVLAGVSLFRRNPMMVSNILLLQNLLLIWSCFLPLNRYWSVDAALDPQVRDHLHPCMPIWAMRVQISSIYFFSGLFKLAGEPWMNGSAVQRALEDGVYGQVSSGLWLVNHMSELFPLACIAIIVFQLLFVVLIYSPVGNTVTRAFALLGAVFMHLSFLHFLRVGLFPYLSFIYLLLLVPDTWWMCL